MLMRSIKVIFEAANWRALIKHQFARFVLVGIINSIFGYGCFTLLLYVGLHYSIALLLATVVGVLFNFKSLGFLVFGSRNNSLIFRFISCYIAVYAVNVLGVKILLYMGVSAYLSGAILIIPMALIAFILNTRFVFSHV